MKIGFDAKRLFNNFTGLGNYSRTLVNQLSKQFPQNEYSLYTPKYKLNSETEHFAYQKNIHLRAPKKALPLWREVRSLKLIKKDGIDIYHGLSHELPIGIQKAKVKSIVTIHDLIFKVYPKTYKSVDRAIYDHKFKYACQNSDAIVAISESTKHDIVKYYGISEDKIKVVYQACNPLYLDLQSESEVKAVFQKYQLPKHYLLYVGSIIERKGLLKIVQALELTPKDNRLPLAIIGKGGDYAEKVKAYAKEKGLEEHLIWTLVESNKELQALYQGASIFIYPSIYEGFGIPVVEALLSNTPVVTSNVSSLPEAAGPNSKCVNPNSPEEISKAITEILENPTLQETMKEEGRKYAETTFNNESVTAQMMEVYEKVLSSK